MAARSRLALPVPLSLLLVSLVGCGPAHPGGAESQASLRESEADIRIANSLSTHALVLNAISTNPQANGYLATRPLVPLFHPSYSGLSENIYLRQQLNDADAQQFMEYLVSCALKTGQDLPYFDPLGTPPGTKVWRGKAGLCPQWANSAPSQDCLNRVSACILARNNALGKRVELSIRGEYPAAPATFSLESMTRPAEFDPDTKVWLPSFQACGVQTLGAQRDCGWKADGIGSCAPGSTVWVGAGGQQTCPGTALGATTGARMVLRVCSGTVGCDYLDARYVTKAESSCAGTAPAVSFTCPAEGYFSVMTAPWDSLTSGTATVATDTTTANYPMSEQAVFNVREGAFYGNIFDPKAIHPDAYVEVTMKRDGDRVFYVVVGDSAVVEGSVYRKMYSCYDSAWTDGAGYSSNRVCALPSSNANCAATVVGPCWSWSTPSLGKCALQDGPILPGDGDYEQCKDPGGTVWNEPVTVFLNQACDGVPEHEEDGTSTCTRKGRGGTP